METLVVRVTSETINAANSSVNFGRLLNSRLIGPEEWIEAHASGTLRKNKRIGFSWSSQYRIERTAWEFGWNYEILPSSRLSVGTPFTEGDCRACTEAGWHVERLIERNPFIEDIYEVKYIHASASGGKSDNTILREGIGVIVRQTCASWIPKGHTIFAFISIFDPITKECTKINSI